MMRAAATFYVHIYLTCWKNRYKLSTKVLEITQACTGHASSNLMLASKIMSDNYVVSKSILQMKT